MSGLATTGKARAWVTVVLRVDSSCGDGNGGLYVLGYSRDDGDNGVDGAKR